MAEYELVKPGKSRAEQLAAAYLEVARANHYMVGIVDPAVTDDELSAARQLLIDGQNVLTEHGSKWQRYDLALDMVDAEESRRTSAASRGAVELEPEPEPEGAHNLNLDCMAPDDLAEVQRAMTTLAAYAGLKCHAMQFRARGMVEDALRAEADCDRLYGQLPEDWRW